jgi:hypothetical protein
VKNPKMGFFEEFEASMALFKSVNQAKEPASVCAIEAAGRRNKNKKGSMINNRFMMQ